jgi:hypothetical protein
MCYNYSIGGRKKKHLGVTLDEYREMIQGLSTNRKLASERYALQTN